MIGQASRLLAVALWLAAVTALLAWAEFRPSSPATSLALGGVLLGVGFAVTAVILVGQDGQLGNAGLFALLTLVWTASQAGLRGVGPLTLPLIWLGVFTQILAAAVLLRYPGDRLDREGRWFVVACTIILSIIQVGLVLTGSPETWDEPLDDRNWSALWPAPEVNRMLWQARWATWALAGVVFLGLLWRRWRRLGGMERRTLGLIVGTAAVTGTMIAARFVDDLLPRSLALLAADVRAYSAAAVSLAFAVSALQLKLARAGVAELATELARSATVERVRDALRRALADPSLEVWYGTRERGAFVNDRGLPRAIPDVADRLVVEVEDTGGRPLAVITADSSLSRHRALVDSAIAVSRLAMENAGLQASLRAQLLAVQETRARLLHAGLEQRRQLERDLHDGAQQRLLALGMRLGALENQATSSVLVSEVQRARHELHQALDELRDLAHGLYPAILTQAGLGPALEAVIERMSVRVDYDIEPGRWLPDLESAAYLIVCEALTNICKHAGPCAVQVQVRAAAQELVVEVEDDGRGSVEVGRPSSLRTIRDRVDAMGGALAVSSVPGRGTRLTASLPCE